MTIYGKWRDPTFDFHMIQYFSDAWSVHIRKNWCNLHFDFHVIQYFYCWRHLQIDQSQQFWHVKKRKRSCFFQLIKRLKNPRTSENLSYNLKAVLRENNYPLTFINNCERALTRRPADINFNGFVELPYVQGVSERIGRVLKQVGVSYRPLSSVNHQQPVSTS